MDAGVLWPWTSKEPQKNATQGGANRFDQINWNGKDNKVLDSDVLGNLVEMLRSLFHMVFDHQ